jgi:hypothetical protein
MPRQSHGRIQAAITGQAKKAGPEETHERTVLAITRRIHWIDRKVRQITRELHALKKERREKRRELRVALQRDAKMGIEGEDERLILAGKPDAIDISEAVREKYRDEPHPLHPKED